MRSGDAVKGRRPNLVALLGAATALLAAVDLPFFAPGWLLFKPNRIVLGEAHGLFALSSGWAWPLLGIWCLLALSCCVPLPRRSWWLGALASAGLAALVLAISAGTRTLVAGAPGSARVSLQGGVWLMLLGTYIAYFGALSEGPARAWRRFLLVAPGPVAALVLIALGSLDGLGIARELAGRGGDFWSQAVRHIALAGTSVLLAAAIGVPAAVWSARREDVAAAVLPAAGLLQTLPSLALFGLMLAPLARLGAGVSMGEALVFGALALVPVGALALLSRARRRLAPALRRALAILALLLLAPPLALLSVLVAVALYGLIELLLTGGGAELSLWAGLQAPLAATGVRGIGTAPALIALTLYALLPIVRNTYTGIREVPRSAVEAGRGMGMSARQILGKVELPLALPLIVEGLRASSVLTIGITTVAFLIGAGGLGTFIEKGISQRVPDLILLGAIPIILLALLADGLLRWASLLVTSPGVRG